jgi:starch synthase (maltosyl-transferring)
MATLAPTGRQRVVIENVTPQINGGMFAVKRILGQQVVVSADVLADGHDHLICYLQYRPGTSRIWNEIVMLPLGNDRWQTAFTVEKVGNYFTPSKHGSITF